MLSGKGNHSVLKEGEVWEGNGVIQIVAIDIVIMWSKEDGCIGARPGGKVVVTVGLTGGCLRPH